MTTIQRPIQLTEETYRELCREYQGICIQCLATKSNCEPDARKYQCEACELFTVYGTEELLMMGQIKIVATSTEEDELNY